MSTKSDRICVGHKARPLLILSAKAMDEREEKKNAKKKKRQKKTILNYADDTGEKNERI